MSCASWNITTNDDAQPFNYKHMHFHMYYRAVHAASVWIMSDRWTDTLQQTTVECKEVLKLQYLSHGFLYHYNFNCHKSTNPNLILIWKSYYYIPIYGTWLQCSWVRQCATSWKVMGLTADGVNGIFHWLSPSSCTTALTEMNVMDIFWE